MLPEDIKVFMLHGTFPKKQREARPLDLSVGRSHFGARQQPRAEVHPFPFPSQAQALPPAPPSTPHPSGSGGAFWEAGREGGLEARPPGGAASFRFSVQSPMGGRPGQPPGDLVGASLPGPTDFPNGCQAPAAMAPTTARGSGRRAGPERNWGAGPSPSAGTRGPTWPDSFSLDQPDRGVREPFDGAKFQDPAPPAATHNAQQSGTDEGKRREWMQHLEFLRMHHQKAQLPPPGYETASSSETSAEGVHPTDQADLKGSGKPEPEVSSSLPSSIATSEKEAVSAAYQLLVLSDGEVDSLLKEDQQAAKTQQKEGKVEGKSRKKAK